MSLEKFIGQLEEINEIIEMYQGRYSDFVQMDFMKWLLLRREDIKDKIATELDYLEDYYLGGEWMKKGITDNNKILEEINKTLMMIVDVLNKISQRL